MPSRLPRSESSLQAFEAFRTSRAVLAELGAIVEGLLIACQDLDIAPSQLGMAQYVSTPVN